MHWYDWVAVAFLVVVFVALGSDGCLEEVGRSLNELGRDLWLIP